MIKISSNIKLYVCLMAILVSFFMPINAAATNINFYSANDILFYDPTDTGCVSATSNSTVDITNNDTLQQIFTSLTTGTNALNAGQASAVMGNMYQESSFDSDEHEAGNDLGYGLVQWTNDPPDYTTGRRANLEAFAASKGVANSNIPMQIEFLLKEYNDTYKAKLASTAFASGTDLAKSTEAWMDIFEVPLKVPANDPAKLNSKRIPAAQAIYNLYGYLAPNSSLTVSNGCNSSDNGVVAGNIVQTAENMALTSPATEGMNQESQARDTYQTAKTQYNPADSDGVPSWSDCGGFVATVMIASGVDPNYPKVGVSTQLAYVKAHPEKYQVIDKSQSTSFSIGDLQPGDIIIKTKEEHTIIYTGQTNYPYVDASLSTAPSNGRVPSVRTSDPNWMLDGTTVVVRLIQ
jgi:hypothetical protein